MVQQVGVVVGRSAVEQGARQGAMARQVGIAPRRLAVAQTAHQPAATEIVWQSGIAVAALALAAAAVLPGDKRTDSFCPAPPPLVLTDLDLSVKW